jgi:hypothetical protein
MSCMHVGRCCTCISNCVHLHHPAPPGLSLLWHRFFLAGDDARCQAADDEVLAHARVREEQVLAEVEALKQVRRGVVGLH